MQLINLIGPILLAGYVLSSCGIKKVYPAEKICTITEALTIADNYMRKKRYDLTDLNRRIVEGDSVVTITYENKNPFELGGGAEVRISKTDCKILDVKRYQ